LIILIIIYQINKKKVSTLKIFFILEFSNNMYNNKCKVWKLRNFFMQKSKKYFLVGLIFVALLIVAKTAYSQDAEYYYFKGNSCLTSGKMSEAIKYYNQAINNDNSFFEAYLGLSVAYKESGDYDKALKSVQYAISLKPDYYQAYYNVGLILEKQNRNDEAIKAYEKFLKGVPGASKFFDAKQRILKLKKSN